jgi:hypothetical protein
VDASQAGIGQLEISVENGKIPCTFTSQGNLKFVPTFTPREAGQHNVTIKFNGIEVAGNTTTSKMKIKTCIKIISILFRESIRLSSYRYG